MSPAPDTTDQLREQANDLYWNSSDAVGQLATRLGMSRNAVYASVRPIAADVACAQCGEMLVYTNRTNRSTRTATCPACETLVTLEEDGELVGAGTNRWDGSNPTAADAAPVPPPSTRWQQLKEDLSAVPPERAAKIGGAAALGAALGAVAVKAVKKRS